MLYEKFVTAYDTADIETFLSLMHDDFQWTRHSDGSVITYETMLSEGFADWFTDIMINSQVEERRCIYENEDILVMHEVETFSSGNRDATISVFLKRDGLLWRVENGSTPLPRLEG